MSPTARTLEALRKSNYVCDVVERWLPRAGKRRDFLGCMDIVACRRGVAGCLAIQATTLSNLSARIAKARSLRELVIWLSAGNGFEVWAWWRHREAAGK